MKKKYYILAFTFLCLLIGQSSFAQDWDDIIEDHSSSDYFPLDWDYINATQLKGVTVINYYYSIPIPIVSYPSYPTPSDISVEYNSGDGGSPSGWTDSNAPNTCSTICFGEYVVLDKEKCECIKLPRPWYLDNDGDGWHNKYFVPIEAAESPGSFYIETTLGEDCDDTNKLVTSDCYRNYYIDNDGDDWDGGTIRAIDDNGGLYKLTTLGTDCDDNPTTGANVHKLNKCGKCEAEPVSGSCGGDDCDTSVEDLKKVFPNTSDARLKIIADAINKYGKSFGLDTKEKLQHFLAQAGVESHNLEAFKEYTNYQPSRAMEVFSGKFNDLGHDNEDSNKKNLSDFHTVGNKYLNAEDFYNWVYADANRNSKTRLGNTVMGDGWLYRGRGIIQLTGRENYANFSNWYSVNINSSINILNNPNLLQTNIELGTISGMYFFNEKILKKMTIDENTSINKITKKVNSKMEGLKERINYLNKAKENINCIN